MDGGSISASEGRKGARLLVLEDEEVVRRAFVKTLTDAGYEVEAVETKTQARALLDSQDFSALLLDRRLPDGDGLDLCRELRGHGRDIAVIVLTALGDDDDIVEGLDAGADDYVSKLSSSAVLCARVAAVLRRSPDGAVSYDELAIDPLRGQIVLRDEVSGEEHIALSTRELRLFAVLADQPDTIVLRQTVVEAVWGSGRRVNENTIDGAIKRLRKKLGGRGDAIVTVKGTGFMLLRDALTRH